VDRTGETQRRVETREEEKKERRGENIYRERKRGRNEEMRRFYLSY
jgi:hypothetical protein